MIIPLLDKLPEEAKPLKEDQYHITLLQQYWAKQVTEWSKRCQHLLPESPTRILSKRVFAIERPGRKSWISLVVNQDEWHCYLNAICAHFGIPQNCEPRRVYHVSLANLEGNPFKSVGDINISDFSTAEVIP